MAASSSSAILFTDVFVVSDVDKDGKKFDRVSRVAAKSNNLDMRLTLDINTDLLDLQKETTFSLALASTLNPESDKSNSSAAAGGWRADIEGGLADDWDYIMHGKVYKFDEGTSDEVTAYVSFGGLLMALTGSYRHVSGVTVGEYIYLLVRK
ncbi:DNA-directed RNA polymerase core subunit RPB8 [Sporobolomyces koalae]|uniref:DNA-directed RNA polymerase core subunit RPB8 n=1 Tax=Sporobolomyces koalae TaxID=500713 RepID=UPI00316D68AC